MKYLMPKTIEGTKIVIRGITYHVMSIYCGDKNIAQTLGGIMVADFNSEILGENLYKNSIDKQKQL